jgi:hypothetical protein
MHDAFRDAELFATALDQTFTDARPFEDAMGHYQSTRDQQVLPCTSSPPSTPPSSLHPPSSSGSWAPCTATSRRWTASPGSWRGSCPPRSFFSEENVGRMLAMAH